MMFLRPLLRTIPIYQKLYVYHNLNRYWSHPVSLSAFLCTYKEESSTTVENTNLSPENDRVFHKKRDPRKDYEYYIKFANAVKEKDKKTPSKLKTSKVIKEDCPSSSLTSLLPDVVKKKTLTQFPVKDHSLETDTLNMVSISDRCKDTEKSSILSDNADPTEETAISEGSRNFSGPFLQASAENVSDMHPKKSADLVRELNRRRYTDITTSYNLAVYVNESETLKQLVSLGVDLSAVEKVKEAANFIIRLNFESDVKPYLLLLKDIGVSDDKLGEIITKNPLIFQACIIFIFYNRNHFS